MATGFHLLIPRNMTSEEKNSKLENIIKKYNWKFSFGCISSNNLDSNSAETRIYEIPETVMTYIVNGDYFKIDMPDSATRSLGNALVSLSGFDPSSQEYNGLKKDFIDLQNEYQELFLKQYKI